MRRFRAAVAAATFFALVGLGGAQAQQQQQQDPCAASAGETARIDGSITAPDADLKVFNSGDGVIAITGSGFRYKPATLFDANGRVTNVRGEVIRCDGKDGLPTPPSASNSSYPNNNDPRSFTWSPRFAYNAKYAAKVVVTASTGAERTIVRPFFVDLPPSPPQNVRVTTTGNDVVVSWDQNPEPDIQGYVVQWTKIADDGFAEAKKADILREGTNAPATRFEHQPGVGEWQYRVMAVRTSTSEAQVRSSQPAAASSTAKIDAPPTTTAANGAGGSATAAGGTTATTAKPAGSPEAAKKAAAASSVDLSAFSKLLDDRRKVGAPKRAAAEPDPGFDETLPFQAGDEPAVAAAPENDQPTFAQRVISDDGDRRRAMTFVAGGLLAFVVAFGLRLVKSQAERVDLEPTTPEDPEPAAVAAAPLDAPDASEAGFAAPAVATKGVEFDPMPLLEEAPPLDLEPMRVPAAMPAPKAAAPLHAPALDVALPARRHGSNSVDEVGTGNGRGTAHRVSPRDGDDRGAGEPAVRPRRRGTGSGDRRAPVG
jgi:hypothetical protein